ncbi:MAG: xylulose kinase, partial [Mesorhizobium sp.]
PYWDGSARGAIVGLSLDHEPKHLFRAVLEGIALEQAIATEAMEEQTGKADAMIAAGGGTNCALLMEIMASVLERPLFVWPARQVDPVEALVPTYRARKEVYRDLYHATRDIHTRLGAIT